MRSSMLLIPSILQYTFFLQCMFNVTCIALYNVSFRNCGQKLCASKKSWSTVQTIFPACPVPPYPRPSPCCPKVDVNKYGCGWKVVLSWSDSVVSSLFNSMPRGPNGRWCYKMIGKMGPINPYLLQRYKVSKKKSKISFFHNFLKRAWIFSLLV